MKIKKRNSKALIVVLIAVLVLIVSLTLSSEIDRKIYYTVAPFIFMSSVVVGFGVVITIETVKDLIILLKTTKDEIKKLKRAKGEINGK